MPVLLLQFDNLLQPQASLNLGVKLVVKFVKNPMLLTVNEKKMGKKLILEKEVFVLSRVWNKEKILSPHEESNLRPGFHAPMLYHWATGTLQCVRSTTKF